MFIPIQEYLKSTKPLSSIFYGKVIDNNDPKKLKRIKVEVQGLFEGKKENLPWCYQIESGVCGNTSDTGIFSVPKIDSIVEISFIDNDIYTPRYRNRHDVLSHQTEFDENYPNKYGIIDGGFKLTIDRIKSEMVIIHPSGTKVKIIEDGTVELNTVKKLNINANDKVSITTTNDLELDGSGGKLKLSGGKVGIGGSQELVDLVSQIADTLSQTLGNLGYPISTASQFATLKSQIDSIKGGL